MIDTKNRLIKLVNRCDTYEQFEFLTRGRTHWYFAPYVAIGHNVTKEWLREMFNNFKPKGGK